MHMELNFSGLSPKKIIYLIFVESSGTKAFLQNFHLLSRAFQYANYFSPSQPKKFILHWEELHLWEFVGDEEEMFQRFQFCQMDTLQKIFKYKLACVLCFEFQIIKL